MSKGERTRRIIVNEALELASTVGLNGLTIGSLAKTLKMSKSGLFAHFRSKQQLELEVLEEAKTRFIEQVISPALKKSRGEPRIRALFENLLAWDLSIAGGCVFISAAAELDDQPGPSREALVANRLDWLDTLEQLAKTAVTEGHFRESLDCQQFAFEMWSLALGFHQYYRLLNDPRAEERLRLSFNCLLDRCR